MALSEVRSVVVPDGLFWLRPKPLTVLRRFKRSIVTETTIWLTSCLNEI